jgi:hypothetical protein
MRTITLDRKSGVTRIEAPGCVISIDPGLAERSGPPACSISIAADGNRYSGAPEWWVNGVRGDDGRGVRIVQTPRTYAPAPVLADRPLDAVQALRSLIELHDRYMASTNADIGEISTTEVEATWESARSVLADSLSPSDISAAAAFLDEFIGWVDTVAASGLRVDQPPRPSILGIWGEARRLRALLRGAPAPSETGPVEKANA